LEYTPENIDYVNCVVCGKQIYHENASNDDKLENCNWSSGSVTKLETCYGSNFDGDEYIIGICDECIKRKNKTGDIIFLKDTLLNYSDDELENVKNKKNRILHLKLKLKTILNK